MTKKAEESKYIHYCFEEETEPKFLLGVPYSIAEDELPTLWDYPLVFSPVKTATHAEWMQLKPAYRQTLYNLIQHWQKTEQKDTTFHYEYWEAFEDFILRKYGKSLYKIAQETHSGQGPNRSWDAFVQQLYQLKKVKTLPSDDTLDTLKQICAYYLMTDDILKTGKGSLYVLSPAEYSTEFFQTIDAKYTPQAIQETWEQHPKWSLKQLIVSITGLKKEHIQECEVRIAFQADTLSEEHQKELAFLIKQFQQIQ